MKVGKVALGELARVRTGKLDANASSPNGKYPFFTCAINPLRIDTFSYECECVLVAGNGDLNVKYHNGRFDAYQRTYIVEPISESLDCRYLYHFLDSYLTELRKLSIGGVIKYIKLGNLTDAQIPLPPLEEQRRIAAILDKAQDISHKSQLSDALASSLIESEMIRRFGRPGENQAHSRILSLIEAGVSVIDCPHSTPKWTEEGRVCLRTSNLGKGNWIWEDTRRISDDDFQERSRRAYLEPGDIVLSREGTVGIAAIVTTDMDACMGQRLVQLKLDSRHLTPEYLLAQLLYLLKPERISHAMAGSTSKHINVKDLRELKINCPPIQEQFAFDDFCKQTKKVRARITLLKKNSEILSRSIQAASFCS